MIAPSLLSHPTVLKISKFISDFFNPFTSLILYFIYLSYKSMGLQESLLSFLPKFLLLVLPIFLWIYFNVKRGVYTNMDVSNRKQRKSLYIFAFICMITYIGVYRIIYKEIDHVMVFLVVLMLLMQASNFFIKSSMHTALNVYAAALFFSLTPWLGFVWLGIAALVGLTRIILKRHSVAEVLVGAFLGLLVSLLYLYFHIQSTFS